VIETPRGLIMKEIVVISGKGGTGKTSIAGALAAKYKRLVLADVDVDAPNFHLIANPSIRKREQFKSGFMARIKPGHCTACGKCEELCRFDAISFTGPGNGTVERTFEVDPVGCEGCGVCYEFCCEKAIVLEEPRRGEWYVSDTRFGPMVHARLDPGAANSGRLVSLIRKQAREIASSEKLDLILTDGAPGIGCQVIASLTGASLAVVVVEPTPAGAHDAERVLDLADHFRIPSAIVINKWDLNPEYTEKFELESGKRNRFIGGRISFDPAVVDAQESMLTIPELSSAEKIKNEIDLISERLSSFVKG
jgi:MinD superfamily P-loop ATPase